jgi:hypothetical protein
MLASLAMAAALGWAGAIKHRNAQDARAKVAASEAARDDERLMSKDRTRIDDAKNQELRAVGDRLADALERVRERPGRLPEAARTSFQGSTGAEVSGPDAAVLERLAARADQLRAELGACQDREWATYQALTGQK